MAKEIEYYKKYEPIDGKWYITKELGKGAFGVVYEVERRDFSDTRSALKIISIPSSKSELEEFRQEHYELDEKSITSYYYGFVEDVTKEFKIMSQLRGHSNIVSFEDYNIVEHTDDIGWDIFIRMELLTPMNKYFSQNKLTVNSVVKLGIDICKALEVCSKHNIIHRDIKPANIFISNMGEFKLGDFGIARTLEKTTSGLSQKGTYTYMAPEIYKGDMYGANVDIYSLGIVMYKLLNNNLEPFRTNMTYGDMQNAFAKRMSGEKIPCPMNANGKLASIILKACSYNPAERFQNPTQMRESLESILNGLDYNIDSDKIISFEPSVNNVDEESDETEVMKENITKNKQFSEKKKIGIAIAVIVCLFSLVITFLNTNVKDFLGNSSKTILTLTAEKEISEEDEKTINETFTARATAFNDSVKYRKDGDKYNFVISDKNMFGRTSEERKYNYDVLKSRGNFRIILQYGGWISDFGKEGIEQITVEKENTEKFSLLMSDKLHESIQKIIKDTETEEIYYIHVKLNSQASLYFKECIKKAKENNTYMKAIGNVDFDGSNLMEYDELGYVIDVNPDGTEFYLLSEYFDSEFTTGVLLSMLETKELPCFFDDVLNEEAVWDEAVDNFGKNQKKEITGRQVSIEIPINIYVSDYDEKSSDQKFNEYVKNIKKRIDKLNTPYMLGFKGIDSRTLIVRLSPEIIGSDYVRMIFSEKEVDIYSQYRNIYANIESLQPSLDTLGNVCLQINVQETKQDLIKEYDSGFDFSLDESNDEISVEGIEKSGEGKNVYLVVNDVTIASAELSRMDGNTLYFSNFLCFNEEKATDEEIPILDLVSYISSEEDYYSSSYSEINVLYSEDGREWKETNDIPWKYTAESEIDKQVFGQLKEMGYDVTRSLKMRNALIIDFKIDQDDEFVDTFIAEVKKVYDACDFDSGSYATVYMRIKNESKEYSSDRARFVVNKDSYSNGMSLTGIFAGPTYEKYADAVKNKCSQDDFFIQRNFHVIN